jgi:hypothetical protein
LWPRVAVDCHEYLLRHVICLGVLFDFFKRLMGWIGLTQRPSGLGWDR